MIEIEKINDKDKLFKFREEELKTRPMKLLERKINKFLVENDIKFHRQFPIRMGRKKKNRKWYSVSFWLPKYNLALDMVGDDMDKFLYEDRRNKAILFQQFGSLDKIIPINRKTRWEDCEKKLKHLLLI